MDDKKSVNGKMKDGVYLHDTVSKDTEEIPDDALVYTLEITVSQTGKIMVYARNEREAMDITERLTEDEMKKYVGCHHVHQTTKALSVKNRKGERIL